jgi:hypothetical protein
MISFYELIEKIKQRPALYLGKAALSQLQTFLDGYTFALRQVNIPVSQEEQEFEQFQEWIEAKFNQVATQHWSRIILFYSEDERDALERFFQLFNDFINEKKLAKIKEKTEVMSNI